MGDVPSCENCGELDPLTGAWTPTPETPFGEWTCDNCPRAGFGETGPYASKILNAYLLARAGYPFSKDDLSPRDWRLMGLMDAVIRRMDTMEAISQYYKSITSGGV